MSERISQVASTTTTGHIGSSSVPWARSSVDLHWADAEELDNMSKDELPYIKNDWKFQKEYFKHLPQAARVLSHYEAVIQKLGRYLYPNKKAMFGQAKLVAPLLKMKVRATWENWEASNPEMHRAGYLADPANRCSRNEMK